MDPFKGFFGGIFFKGIPSRVYNSQTITTEDHLDDVPNGGYTVVA